MPSRPKRQFVTINDILYFLDQFDYNDYALIEVVRTCYFTIREKRAFEYYPQYINGKLQADIGVILGWTQGLVSVLFKQCRMKLQFFKKWYENDIHGLVSRSKTICTPREWSVLEKLLAGASMVSIAELFNCTKFNICLLTKSALCKIKKSNSEDYYLILSMLRFLKTIKTQEFK